MARRDDASIYVDYYLPAVFKKVSNVLHRCGSRIEEPNGANVNALLQSPFQCDQSPWHPSTIAIPRRQVGLGRPTVVWTRRGMDRGRWRITCLYQAMGLLCTCTIHCRQTGIHQGLRPQNLLRTVLKSVPWQPQVPGWGGRPLLTQTSPFRNTVLPSNFRLVRMLSSNVEITLPLMAATVRLGPWRHKISVTNVSLRYSVLSGIPQALQHWEWRPKSTRWWSTWRERIMEEPKCKWNLFWQWRTWKLCN